MARKVKLIELDKAGSEWVITAYLADEPRMIEVIESGKKPHTVTGSLLASVSETTVAEEHAAIGSERNPDLISEIRQDMPGLAEAKFLPRTMSIYQCGKKSNHGFNYKLGSKKWGRLNEVPESEAILVRKQYLNIYALRVYWADIEEQLKQDRTLYNCFGRRRTFRARWDDDLFKAAYAWKPQSTSVEIVNRAMVKFWNDERLEFQRAELLLHRHDSLTFQHPGTDTEIAQFISSMTAHMDPALQGKERKFVVQTTVKIGPNLGEMVPYEAPV